MSARGSLSTRSRQNCCITASDVTGQSRHAPQVTASFTGLLDRTALERRLFCDPSSSIEYDAVTNPYCPRRSDNGVYPSAWVLAKITDLLPIVSNECPKNIRILG